MCIRDCEVCLNLCHLHLFQMVSALPLVMLLRVEGKTSPRRLSKKWLLRIFISVLNSKIPHWSQWTQEATQSGKTSSNLFKSFFFLLWARKKLGLDLISLLFLLMKERINCSPWFVVSLGTYIKFSIFYKNLIETSLA